MEEFIKSLFRDVIENPAYDEQLVRQYFDEEYIQTVDNQTLDFEMFLQHVQKLKLKVKSQKVHFENIVANEHFIFTKHIANSVLLNGETVQHKVFAEFEINNGKVIRCDELTMLLKGDVAETNLGSEI